ncbi:MAG: radical SAM family heme chaperone HemW [Planctomycetes bacterium]|nr:radical SAM family heme chaperone HemW [Planctomycetota bacterium]
MQSGSKVPVALELAGQGPEPLAAYLHVPFCYHRCGYCNFTLLAGREDLHEQFVEAILTELSWLEAPQPVQTIFLGGGTPSILRPELMERLLEGIAKWLPIHGIGEWSIEANPRDITLSNLKRWSDFGINRVSIGGQSFQARKLQVLERDHRSEELNCAIELAMSHMPRVSLDLIFAAPQETLMEWQDDLEKAVCSGVGHVSTYGLTFEKGASFYGRLQRQEIAKIDEQLELDMYNLAIDTLEASGIEHYEISNFAVQGQTCQHNQSYWNSDRWWGFGPSAASYLGNTRSVNHRGTLQYLRKVQSGVSPIAEQDHLSIDQQCRERFVFGMRQRKGVDWENLKTQFPDQTTWQIQNTLHKHIEHGWMEHQGAYVRLTRSGLVISDGLWNEYLTAR